MKYFKIKPKFIKYAYPKIGLIALASDNVIERDFRSILKDKKIDLFVNRIESYNLLTKKNLIKMSKKITKVTSDILPGEKVDCVAYACTSGTIAAGFKEIKKKSKKSKTRFKINYTQHFIN